MPKHDTQPIWYEPHPVSVERKAEIRAKGFRILDAVFMPEGYVNPGAEQAREVSADSNGDGKVTAAELRAALAEKGVTFKASASKPELQALLDAASNPTS